MNFKSRTLFFSYALLLGFFFFASCSTQKKPTQPLHKPVSVFKTNYIDTTDLVVKDGVSPLLDTNSQTISTQSTSFEEDITPVSMEVNAVSMFSTGVMPDARWLESHHYDVRKPNFVIIHHTAQNSVEQTLQTFRLPHTKVSSHYVISREGNVYQMLNDFVRGWHAGKGKWGSVTDINSVSLGIELDNNGKEPFTNIQIEALLTLLDTLKTKYNIPQANFIGHSDIAPTRKDDPSVFFPWRTLAERGFGIWYNEDYLNTPPANFNPMDALRIIGYDISNLPAAIRVFKRKFTGIDTGNAEWTAYDLAVLYDLYMKF